MQNRHAQFCKTDVKMIRLLALIGQLKSKIEELKPVGPLVGIGYYKIKYGSLSLRNAAAKVKHIDPLPNIEMGRASRLLRCLHINCSEEKNNAQRTLLNLSRGGFLTLHTMHPIPSTQLAKNWNSHMTQIDAFAVTGSLNTFRWACNCLGHRKSGTFFVPEHCVKTRCPLHLYLVQCTLD